MIRQSAALMLRPRAAADLRLVAAILVFLGLLAAGLLVAWSTASSFDPATLIYVT